MDLLRGTQPALQHPCRPPDPGKSLTDLGFALAEPATLASHMAIERNPH